MNKVPLAYYDAIINTFKLLLTHTNVNKNPIRTYKGLVTPT